MAGISKEFLKDHKLFRIRNKNIIAFFPLIAVLVAFVVFWGLKLVGITITSEALCNLEAHSHNITCYEDGELVCTKPEHSHSAECFPQKGIDVETSRDWKKTFEHVKLTDDVAENLISIAFSQTGYTESADNYEYNALAEKHNYTRYGEWYGTPYGEWNTLFVSFCLNYANINDSDSVISASAESMRRAWDSKKLYFSADKYTCSRGDIAFFDTGSDKKADRTGIVIYNGKNVLVVIEGDVDGEVKTVSYRNRDSVIGYGKTSGLYSAGNTTGNNNDQSIKLGDISGKVNRYIPNNRNSNGGATTYNLRRSTSSNEPLVTSEPDDQDITYISHLEDEVVAVVFKEMSGQELTNGSTIYIGETYMISLEFSEINSGSEWIQFRHNEDGYLTYQLPENIHCEPFDDWQTISAKTENGTITDVGEYFMDENGLLRVKFYNDANGVNFVEKYSNVDFTIEFNATVANAQAGSSTEIKFNDKINVNMNVDGNASMKATKIHGEYDPDNHTMEYTIRVQATHGVVKDLVLDDQIWENHQTLRDTVVVTDLNGNLIDPQPTISPVTQSGVGQLGSVMSGFPDFAAGEGFIIKYKTQITDAAMTNETVSMWNGAYLTGKNSLGNDVTASDDDWLEVELEKMNKEGKQVVITDKDGNEISVIKWEVEIRKDNHNLQGTVVIDTLGEGLQYYKDKNIVVEHYDQYGNRLPDTEISWNNVTITDNKSMSFALPDGYAFKLVYYTTFEAPEGNETKKYSNRIKATINGREESASGSANVVGFVPHVKKSASGKDGEFVYYTIEADVPAVIKDWGNFYLTDLLGFWGYPTANQSLLVQNVPQDLVITATTNSGQVINFTPYQNGGTVENTYILVTPAEGNQEHSFNIFFNTADANATSSKWILAEDSTLKITYKIPFDARTGTEWTGTLTGDLTVEDVLLMEYKLANEAYLTYTNIITGSAVTTYEYAPQITKKSIVNETGVIDYTVTFNNSIPGEYGNLGYINSSVNELWFNDTFDDKLEYVPGSLVVTTYSPWDRSLWVTKYRYNGTVDGNTIRVDAGNFTLIDYNEAADVAGWNWISTAPIFRNYYQWVSAGGVYEFTYQLKVKEEHLLTTDFAKFELDNTAELTWGNDQTSGPATETSVFYTGLLHKHAVQDDSKLDFEVHINRESLDILEGSDTLTVQDTMTPNLSVYWDSIKLVYENENGEMIDFTSPESKYTYTVTYSPANNSLTFIVPDSLHIIIDYTTLITESGLVSVENSVLVDGKAEVADIIDAFFHVQEHSGGASGSNHKFTLIKQDGMTNLPLSNATFLLYGLKGDTSAALPAGASRNIVMEDGTTLKFIGAYTTGEYGTTEIETQYLTVGGPYALVEYTPPEGYDKMTEPVYFYFYNNDPEGIMQTVTTLIAIENYKDTFLIPETGSVGIFTTATIGIALVAFPILYSLIRRNRKRRFLG